MRRIALFTLITTLLLTAPTYAGSLQDMKPSGGSDPNSNVYQYEEGYTPNTDDLMKGAQKAEETVEDSHWDIKERETSIPIDLNKGTTRFEVFYTASGVVPYIAFQTPDGDIYEAGKDSDNIVARPNNTIEGHSDLRYEVIYITAPSSARDVRLKIALDSKTRDFMLIQSTVPAKWQTFREEFRTNPEQLIIWGFYNSENTISDLIAIAENVQFNPIDNNTETAAPPVVKKPSMDGLIIALGVMAIVGIGLLLFFNNMDKKHKARDDKERRINKMNRQARKNKQEREKTLDSALDEFDDDYSDDDFFAEKPVTDDVVMPLEEKIAFIEDENEQNNEFARSYAFRRMIEEEQKKSNIKNTHSKTESTPKEIAREEITQKPESVMDDVMYEMPEPQIETEPEMEDISQVDKPSWMVS